MREYIVVFKDGRKVIAREADLNNCKKVKHFIAYFTEGKVRIATVSWDDVLYVGRHET
jgi:hypothetical protein